MHSEGVGGKTLHHLCYIMCTAVGWPLKWDRSLDCPFIFFACFSSPIWSLGPRHTATYCLCPDISLSLSLECVYVRHDCLCMIVSKAVGSKRAAQCRILAITNEQREKNKTYERKAERRKDSLWVVEMCIVSSFSCQHFSKPSQRKEEGGIVFYFSPFEGSCLFAHNPVYLYCIVWFLFLKTILSAAAVC